MLTALAHRTSLAACSLRRLLRLAARGAGLRRGAASRRKGRTERSCRRSPSACPQAPLVGEGASGASSANTAATSSPSCPAPRDIRYISTYAYTRLVGYDREARTQARHPGERRQRGRPHLHLHPARGPSLVRRRSRSRRRISAITGKTSPTTRSCRPPAPPEFMLVDGKPPQFEVLDERTVRYTWDKPNPRFLPQLARTASIPASTGPPTTSSSSTPNTPTRRSSKRRRSSRS